jgi:gas vesicle protein
MTTRNKILIGIISAAAVGAIIGLLTAPDKGTETRKRIGKTTRKWVDHMGRIFHHSADDVAESGRSMSQKSK